MNSNDSEKNCWLALFSVVLIFCLQLFEMEISNSGNNMMNQIVLELNWTKITKFNVVRYL